MKMAKNFAWMVAAVALLLTVAQAEKNQASIALGSTAQINSQQISPGNYNVRWTGSGPSVQVEIVKGSKVVASSKAEVVPLENPGEHNQVLMTVQDNGTRKVQRIDLSKQKVSLLFRDDQASGQ